MRCAVYTRVSTDKEEQKSSLINQKDLFIRYIAEHGWDLQEIYVDVQSGTKMQKRTAFKQMLQDAEDNKFDIILAKELSRLARNGGLSYKVRDLAEQKGLHIITLDGAINTLQGDTSKFGLYAWLYENESQTTSKRVKYALDNRARNGLFKGSIPPYGYKIEKGKLYIRDDDTPSIVRRIFNEYLAGDGQDLIAKRLWEENVQTPSSSAGKINAGSTWHGSSIMLILRNRAYVGDMVQSKTCTTSVTTTKRKKNNTENLIIKLDTHEAIISKEEFQIVQELMKSRSRLKKAATQVHLFTNVVFCADCGHGMHFKANRKGYVCGSYDKMGKAACGDHIIREKELSEAIFSDLKLLISKVQNKNFSESIEKKILKMKLRNENELKKIDGEFQKYKQRKLNALNNLVDNIITKNDYDMLIVDINTRLDAIIKRQQECAALVTQNYNTNNCIKDVEKIQAEVLDIKELTPEILNRFIEKIEIKADGTPKVYYRFSGSNLLL